jgi:hypothetical protein
MLFHSGFRARNLSSPSMEVALGDDAVVTDGGASLKGFHSRCRIQSRKMVAQWCDDGGDYRNFMERLHKCEGGCLNSCPHFNSTVVITSLSIQYVREIAKELRDPLWITPVHQYIVVSVIAPEIWELFNLQQHPLSPDEYSDRSMLVHLMIQAKVIDSCSGQASFPGWK